MRQVLYESEELGEPQKDSAIGVRLLFSFDELKPKENDGTIYRGVVSAQNTSVGEFVASINWHDRTLTVEELFVKPEYRRRGIGKKALGFLVVRARCMELREVVVEPVSSDVGAGAQEALIAWYTQQGFVSRRSLFAPLSRLLAKAV